MAEQQPPGMTIAEVAAYLPKVPRGSVHKLAQRGKIPGQKQTVFGNRERSVPKWRLAS